MRLTIAGSPGFVKPVRVFFLRLGNYQDVLKEYTRHDLNVQSFGS